MKIVRFAAFGVPRQVAVCDEVAEPDAPAEDEVVIEVEAFPINPVGPPMTIRGRYASRPGPSYRPAPPDRA